MSLRQRPLQASNSTSRTTFEPPGQPTNPTQPNCHPFTPPPRKGIRLNRILGRIVPIILLIYIAFAYDLVVVRYAHRHLYLQRRRTLLPIVWLLPAHGLFLWSLRAYLRVFFAHSPQYTNKCSGLISWLRTNFGAAFPDPDEAQQLEQQRLNTLATSLSNTEVKIELCQADGQPLRCWRDNCRARLKAFRMRHCGDCGTCRVGFDHHCAWFDNDVTAPATLRAFVAFLVSIPPLYVIAFGPLFPSAWQTLKQIKDFTASDAVIRSKWYNKWYSWIGGPAFRWIVGYALRAKRWPKSSKDRWPHESPRTPVLVALGAVFVFVATALAASSLTQLRKGMLTVDLERAKAYGKLRLQMEKLEKLTNGSDVEKLTAMRQKMETLSPTQYFKVSTKDKNSGEEKESIVALSPEEGLLSRGSAWANIGRLLGLKQASSSDGPAWLLSEPALRKILQAAALLPRENSN
ncbi:hypothetical protein NDA11_000177 [Ustilago hordei]|uniref:Palmitoyltransferase n=1 Tax=Ustilago hordei TaxID=120017 RepID=I2FZK9_USTHO|nr:uncharacterized protein UHO2_03045 [Ustilago hordei]KAJ1045272.1 hypothetical protein NDA10_003572 [Ustilago hordei]KAJ1577023.1 hypothetical protein NDA15_005322 [Ustilago hordei]KAJ1578766.1 hypothetical protein NDA12_006698 [Ustilago hordei]KAJ1583924.1 hypothetical protein NDA11_000177 [Ustilago hordei]KAJ1599086.1 hypothetical protein NDA14_001452 [Ustilago hordei]